MVLASTPITFNSIDLVIFDCDGVLIDSEVLSKRVLLSMLEDVGVDVSDSYFDKHFLGHSYVSVKAQILTDYAVTLSNEFRQNYLAVLLQVFAKELTPTNELERMLSKLKTASCVATSSSPERVRFALGTTGLADYFSGRIFTCSEVKNGKPAPDIFLHAAMKMGVAPKNCLVIEDSQAGIQGAKAAGMQIVKYAGASHLKSKGVLKTDIANNVKTIFDWHQLFVLIPSLSSSKQFSR